MDSLSSFSSTLLNSRVRQPSVEEYLAGTTVRSFDSNLGVPSDEEEFLAGASATSFDSDVEAPSWDEFLAGVTDTYLNAYAEVPSWEEFLAGATERHTYEAKLEDLYKCHSQEFERKRAAILVVLSKIKDKALELEFQGLDDEMSDLLCQRWNIAKLINESKFTASETRNVNVYFKVWNADCESVLQQMEEMSERLAFHTMTSSRCSIL